MKLKQFAVKFEATDIMDLVLFSAEGMTEQDLNVEFRKKASLTDKCQQDLVGADKQSYASAHTS